MLGNPDLDSPVEDMQGTPCIRCWVSAIFKKLDTEGFEDIYTFLKKPPEFFGFVNLLSENKILPLWILQNCETPHLGYNPIFSKVFWLSLAFWDSSSLTFPDFSQKWITRFTHFS